MKRLTEKLLVLFLIFAVQKSFAQEVKVEASIDTNRVLIGDHIRYSLKVQSKPPTEIILPDIKDTLGKFEIVDVGKIDTNLSNNQFILSRKITLTIFDSGSHTIPSLNILYLKKDTKQYATIQTDSFAVFVKGIEIDTTKDIKDIKGIVEVPYTLWDYLPYIVIALLVAISFYLIYFFLKRRKAKEFVTEELKLPPHIVALNELKQLESEKLWQRGEIKEYHIRLTEIVRKYIERRFNIPALEMISSEIIENLEKFEDLDKSIVDRMRRSLQISDLVKFAKFVPLPDEHTFCLKVAFDFVEATTPKADVQQQESRK
jgi:hypothetical protein